MTVRLRLRTRLTIWFAASILLILAPFLTGTLFLQWRAMRLALDHHLQEDLEVATQMLITRNGAVAWRVEADEDPGYDGGPQRWVEVYGPDGQALFLRGLAAQAAIRRTLYSPVADTGPRTLQTPGGAHVRTLTRERSLGPQRVWVRVARSEDPLREDLRRLILVFSTGAPMAVFAAALAGYLISGRALTPLARIAARARVISAEHLSERLPVENASDELGQLAVVFNDTFARLEASFERLKQFTADASHQLRTPLTAIRSVGEVGLQRARDARAYQEIIGSMLEEADRLARVVDTLLTLARWESGRVRPDSQSIELGAMARDAAAQLSVLAEDRGIGISLHLDHPLVVSADPVMIRQAVTNVLDNAIKFTRDGGCIRITACSTPVEHQLVIDDEGPGIPAAERHRVFERFYRLDRGGDRNASGAGLGLSVVQWAVSANRGRVSIEANPAGGARFILALPRGDFPARL